MISYFEHNKYYKIGIIKEKLINGCNVAVITDAGTPAISDPAYKLVREAIRINSKIESIPGPSAVLASIVASGLPTDRFIFEGFLPPKKGRKKRIENMNNESATIIIYENILRLRKTIKQILEIMGDRPAVICRELTKMHEDIIRGTLSSLLELLESKTFKGECVLLIGKDDENVYFE
jgi:16S rRNA (cytidine1402-2'-O)-methyltransferase